MLDYANYGVTKTRNVNISLGGRRACFKTSACITKNAPNWILNASIAMPVPDPLDVHAEITHGTIGINPLKLKIITLSFSSRKSQRFFVKKKNMEKSDLFFVGNDFKRSPSTKENINTNPRYIQQSYTFLDISLTFL